MLAGEESNTSSESLISVANRRRRVLRFPSSDEDDDAHGDQNVQWCDPKGNQPKIMKFISASGAKRNNVKVRKCIEPQDFYKLCVTEQLYEKISEQTNIYANQIQSKKKSKRIDQWVPTNKSEIKRFFGLILWMGLVKLPSLELYWSKDPAYVQTFPQKVMSRDRFQILLRMLHFSNNEELDVSNRLNKIKPILHVLNENFKKYYNPTEILCIDESLIPFRGRIIFRQYLKGKRHKYGIRLFKLCCGSGYTFCFRVYTGKTSDKGNATPSNIVMDLCKPILNKGHTLCTDNWYTSLDLANKLISKNTHLVGTLRPNRKGNPKMLYQKN